MEKVTVLYKSGHRVYLKVDNLVVTKRGGSIASVTWDAIDPRPLHLGIDEIESIFMGHL